ncbi:MAG: (2Fe-2S) ferredoxin domain-containing protein, partial [Terriglobales bacterium]
MPRLSTPAEIAALKKRILLERSAKPVWVTVCTGTGCCAYGAEGLADSFQKEIEDRGIGDFVGLRRTGCHGFCERGPLVVIQPKGICYLDAKA